MTSREQQILDLIEKAFEYLTKDELEKLYYFGLGLTFQSTENDINSRKVK